MKRIIIGVILFCVLGILCSCSKVEANSMTSPVSIDDVVDAVHNGAQSEFGYSEVSRYYLEDYFSELSNVNNVRIYKCNDSLNFNEFGVFEFTSHKAAKNGLQGIQKYLKKAKENFENGVVYDIKEYPKFQNAKAKVFDNYVIYTILEEKQTKNVFNNIEKTQQNKGL